jgi:hypothetical protein
MTPSPETAASPDGLVSARPMKDASPVHEPYLCIAPACGPVCHHCANAISPATMRLNAVRYSLLQRMDPRFGMPVEWMNFRLLDEAVDSELAAVARATGKEPQP